MRNNPLSMAWITAAILASAMLAVTPHAMAQKEKVVHAFTNYTGGQQLQGGLVFDKAGNIYGVTSEAGQFGYGTVFKLTIQKNGSFVESVLHNFQRDGQDGFRPNGGLVLDASGNLYGTTFNGGSQLCLHSSEFHGCGTVYELTPQADGTWTEQILHDFAPGDGDGTNPYARLIFDAAGNLYGTTYYGGSSRECENAGCGTVFELTPGEGGTWQEKIIFDFSLLAGTNPVAGLTLDATGNLYGTTAFASTGSNGTVFELTPSTSGEWNETILHSFAFGTTDGATPESGVTFDSSGNLYGTTFDGGDEGYGTVYELTPSGGGTWTETIIHNFPGNFTDGAQPGAGALVFDAAGNLYGATTTGGTSFQGALFQFTPSAGGVWAESILHNFAAGRGGNFPSSSIILDSAGNIYGTTAYDDGSVYEIVRPK